MYSNIIYSQLLQLFKHIVSSHHSAPAASQSSNMIYIATTIFLLWYVVCIYVSCYPRKVRSLFLFPHWWWQDRQLEANLNVRPTIHIITWYAIQKYYYYYSIPTYILTQVLGGLVKKTKNVYLGNDTIFQLTDILHCAITCYVLFFVLFPLHIMEGLINSIIFKIYSSNIQTYYINLNQHWLVQKVRYFIKCQI